MNNTLFVSNKITGSRAKFLKIKKVKEQKKGLVAYAFNPGTH